MTLDHACWLATAALGVHIVEEFALDWRGYVRSVSGISVDWSMFYVLNALAILLGVVCAEVARALPMIALAFPALLLIERASLWASGASDSDGEDDRS